MNPSASKLALVLCLLSAPARAGDLKVGFQLPKTVKVGELIRLEVTVTNRTREDLVVREPYESMGKQPRPKFANSAGSQFFLCDADAPSLDNKYTAFGQVVDGLEVVRKIAAAPATQGTDPSPSVPVEPVIMQSVTLVSRAQ